MITLLISLMFSWLPAPIWLCVWAVFSVASFIVVLKLLGIILDFIFKFIDIFV